MKMLKLLIADAGEEFRCSLADQLRGTYRIRLCREGRETLDMMMAFKPDLVVLDMMLPGLDGISILEEATRCGLRPMVLATTKFNNDFVVESAARLGVSYMMVKPCDIGATAQRVQDLAEHLEQPVVVLPEPRAIVSNILLTLGFSTKLRGFGYLREAILEMASNPGQSITKELYPMAGKICDASVTQVERSIRSAINKAWDSRDASLWRRYFGDLTGRPTNAVFISAIADRVRNDSEISGGNSGFLYKMQKESSEKL